jgi:hypothetical protein
MVRLSRRNELVLGVLVFAISVGALALVIKLLIWPQRRHVEPLQLLTEKIEFIQPDPRFLPSDTDPPSVLRPYLCKQRALCCLQLQLLRPPNPTSFVNLPYGVTNAANPTQEDKQGACRTAVAFLGRLGDSPVVFIDRDDDNSVYFNQTTGADIAEYWQTWPGPDPAHPSLYIEVERGDGVTVGAGFLLSVSCVGIVLSSLLLLLRLYDDLHPIAKGSAAEEGLRRSDFSRLNEVDDGDEEAQQQQFASERTHRQQGSLDGSGSGGSGDGAGGSGGGSSRTSSRTGSTHELGEFDGDIELVEERRLASVDEEQMEQLENKDDEEGHHRQLDPPSQSRGRPTTSDAPSSSPRSPTVPRIAPPPPPSQSAAEATNAQNDNEMDLDAFEREMQQHHEEERERKETD